jgi:hypothetical protein
MTSQEESDVANPQRRVLLQSAALAAAGAVVTTAMTSRAADSAMPAPHRAVRRWARACRACSTSA